MANKFKKKLKLPPKKSGRSGKKNGIPAKKKNGKVAYVVTGKAFGH